MINLLSAIFIKNHKDYKDEKVRRKYGFLCGIVGIILNILLFAGKFTAGLISNSISVTADAFNNLSDAGSSFITLIGFKLAGQKPDPEHPFGHGRIEHISGLIVSMLIIIMAYELITDSIDKIIHPEDVETGLLTIIILAVSILIKIYMCIYNSRYSKKISSPAMKATSIDSLSDSIATGVVLISAIISMFYGIKLDGYAGVLVGLFIAYAGFCALKETISPLLGQAPDEELVKEIENLVLEDEMIIGIHDLIVHDYGPGRIMVSLHAEVSYKEDILVLHDHIDTVENRIKNELNCEATIHMDPVNTDDENIAALKKEVADIVTGIDNELNMHDFRVVFGESHTNLIFDIVVPFKFRLSDSEITDIIKSKVSDAHDKYFCVINVDKKYTK